MPDLAELVKSQEGQHLDLSLTIGSNKSDRSMSLQGLKLTLTQEKSSATRLPGANGPTPQLSSGVQRLNIDDQPSFVNLDGRQTVSIEDGCWEIVWKETSPHGYLFSGFQLPTKVSVLLSIGANYSIGSLFYIIYTHSMNLIGTSQWRFSSSRSYLYVSSHLVARESEQVPRTKTKGRRESKGVYVPKERSRS